MDYYSDITLKDGRKCVLRSGTANDGQASLDVFRSTHAETDFLLSYPEEITFTAEEQSEYLRKKHESENEAELVAEIGGKIVGLGGIEPVGGHIKTRHRAGFGVSVAKAYWGLGIGRALTRACVECAKKAGYSQLELEVVADNKSALALYKSEGFTEYGRNPLGFMSKLTGRRELILMRLELGDKN